MAPDDGDSARTAGVRAAGSTDDAFAATVAPTSDPGHDATIASTSGAPTPPQKLPAGTYNLGDDATLAAPVAGALPPLPEVSASLYQIDREIARGGMGRIVAAEDRRLGRPVALKQLLQPG